MFSLSNLLKPRPLWMNLIFTVYTLGLWLPLWALAAEQARTEA